MQWTQIPAILDITISLGDDWNLVITFPFDLTGYTFSATVIEGGTNFTNMTIGLGDIINKKITLSLTDSQITAIGVGIHQYFLKLTKDNFTRRYMKGKFKIEA